ncbi:hypothetical protein QPK87_06725 [Kamptonema cortianum]|nr:hypothetical protein [Kamptonema cortianum]
MSQPVDEAGFLTASWYATPVSGEAPRWDEMVPVRPMRVTQKDQLSGKVRLSGWIKDHSGKTTLRFLVNGKLLHDGTSKDQWSVELDTRRLANGPVKLELIAQRGKEVINRYPVTVTVRN